MSKIVFGTYRNFLGPDIDFLMTKTLEREERVPGTGEDRDLYIVINTDELTLELYSSSLNTLLASYGVCLGQKETPTPHGRYIVLEKWYDPRFKMNKRINELPGPDCSIGRRLIILYDMSKQEKSHISIHGCYKDFKEPAYTSSGCIKMRNPDIEELFERIPLGIDIHISGRATLGLHGHCF
jgi:lipoprotein-anchoring transpeptidase ErfK/SrfK